MLGRLVAAMHIAAHDRADFGMRSHRRKARTVAVLRTREHRRGVLVSPTKHLQHIRQRASHRAPNIAWLARRERLFHQRRMGASIDAHHHHRVALLQNTENKEDTIYRSKAVGEPPFMLCFSVFHAIRDAIATDEQPLPDLSAPATPEAVLRAISGEMS